MREFIYSCRSKNELLTIFQSRDYMLEDTHVYSMHDLVQQYQKKLIPWLNQVHAKLHNHITKNCSTCKGKGDYCEICNRSKEIFPFDIENVTKCPKCSALYHSACFVPYKVKCPKCARTAAIRGNSFSKK